MSVSNSELSAALDVVDRALVAGIITRDGLCMRFNLFSVNPLPPKPPTSYVERNSEEVLRDIEMMLKCGDDKLLNARAGTFIAQMMVKAKKYSTIRFSEAQRKWFDDLASKARDATMVKGVTTISNDETPPWE